MTKREKIYHFLKKRRNKSMDESFKVCIRDIMFLKMCGINMTMDDAHNVIVRPLSIEEMIELKEKKQ